MKIGKFVGVLDFSLVWQYLLVMARLFAYLFILPLLVALISRQWLYVAIFLMISLGTYALSCLRKRDAVVALELREALIVTALAYLFFALLGAFSFLPIAPLEDAFFDAMSAITTTGLSVLPVTELPASLLFFRSYGQWLGGLGVVVLTLVVLNNSGRAVTKLYASEGGRANIRGNLLVTTRSVFVIYCSLTVLAFFMFRLTGMAWFDALIHAMSTLSTGGFSSHESMASYGSSFLTVLVLFMVCGSISFKLFFLAWQWDIKAFILDKQVQVLAFILLIFSLLFWLLSPLTMLESVFQVGSALSTTGFEVVTSSNLPEPLLFLTSLLMMIGGSVGSTAGGLKLMRLLVFFSVAAWVLQKLFLPDEVKLPLKANSVNLRENDIRFAFVYLILYLFLTSFSIFMFMLAGFGLTPAVFESVSALSTVGLSVGLTSAELPTGLKLLLCFDMWAGRLEIIPVLILLSPLNWRLRQP